MVVAVSCVWLKWWWRWVTECDGSKLCVVEVVVEVGFGDKWMAIECCHQCRGPKTGNTGPKDAGARQEPRTRWQGTLGQYI